MLLMMIKKQKSQCFIAQNRSFCVCASRGQFISCQLHIQALFGHPLWNNIELSLSLVENEVQLF